MHPKLKFDPPSKKILYLIGGIVLLFAIILGYKPLVQAIKTGHFNGSLSYSNSDEANSQSTVDTDGDGLKDWQETLWKTDPTNKDTDGDRTSDGDEVSIGRDPLKPGPDDRIPELYEAISLAHSAAFADDPNNLTQQISQKLFAQSATAEANGELDASQQKKIIDATAASLKTEVIVPHYVLTDVRTLEVLNKETIKSFGNDLITIQDKTETFLTPNISNQDAITMYGNLVNELSQVKVPSSLKVQYLNLLNDYYGIYQLLGKIFTSDGSDPAKILLYLTTYQQLLTKIDPIHKEFADYFKKNGIIWTNNEPGHVWNTF